MPKLSTARKLTLGLLGGSSAASAITYLFRDEFTTDAAAPLTSPRTAEPGPGTLTFTDTGNRASIVGGKLRYTRTAGADWGNPGSWMAAVARQTGRALLFEFKSNARAMVGFDTNQASTSDENAFHFDSTSLQARVGGNSFAAGTFLTAGTYNAGVILRTAGAFYVWDGKLVWVDALRTTASVYPALVLGDSGTAIDLDYVSLLDLGVPWNDDYAIATQRLTGARAPGDSFTHEADCIIEFTVTTRPSAGQIELRFRAQDATNYWQVTVDSSGNLDLDEVVDGTPTERGTKATAITNGERVIIHAVGSTLRVIGTNPLDVITYTSATNFATATTGELETEGTGGAVTEIISWPYNLPATAMAPINATFP